MSVGYERVFITGRIAAVVCSPERLPDIVHRRGPRRPIHRSALEWCLRVHKLGEDLIIRKLDRLSRSIGFRGEFRRRGARSFAEFRRGFEALRPQRNVLSLDGILIFCGVCGVSPSSCVN